MRESAASIETSDVFEVHTGGGGGAIGLAMIPEERYDFVLVDLMMSVMDGFEALRQLQDMGADSGSYRVSLLRGMVDPVLQANAREFGGDVILCKPLRLDDLRRLFVDEPDPF
ncbi:MAG TPA: response regulator [Dehalococcoidia bacterium]|nr:response regulator [Dehalococcoidia bacterium]